MSAESVADSIPLGYKQTEGGVIPEDWSAKTWGDVIIHCFSGATPSRSRPDFFKGDIRWITSGELNYKIINDTYEKITQEAVEKTNLKILPKNTFLMAITGLEAEGTRGSCAIVGEESTTNQSCMAIFPNEELKVEYLFHYYVFKGKELALQYCQGTKQQSYTAKIVKLLPITVPPLPEQESIATALSYTDALIESLEQLIAKKLQIKQGAMQELLTGKRRLPGFSGEWQTKLLGDLFEFSGGLSASREQLSTEGYCYLHYGDIHTSDKTYIDVKLEIQDIPKLNIPLKKVPFTSLLESGDVVFVDASEDDEGASKHVVVFNDDKIPFISGLHTIVAKSKTNELDYHYRRYCFQTRDVKQQFQFFAVGTKVTGISKANITKITLPVPPLSEQTAIATILSDMDAEITTLEEKLAKTRQIKQGMMQELLTGRIRLV